MVLKCNVPCKFQKFTSSEQATGYFIMLAMGHDLSQSDWRKVFSENVFIVFMCPTFLIHPCSVHTDASRSWRDLSNEPVSPKIVADTAENAELRPSVP